MGASRAEYVVNRRTLLAGLGTVAVSSLAGCANSASADDQQTTTARATDGSVPTTAEPATSSGSNGRWRSEADPDLPITVANRNDSAQTVTIRVSQVGDRRHEETIEIEPGAEKQPYNLRELDPAGIQRYTITAELGEQSASAVVKTSSCYSDVTVRVQKDGSLDVVYAVC